MRSALAYTPRRGPLSGAAALSGSIYLGSMALVAFVYSNPLVLAAAGGAVVIAGLASGAGAALGLAARWGAALGVLMVAVNALVSQRGETILGRGWDLPVLGQVDVTGEALVEGAVLALRITVVFAAFAVHSACIDPDRMLRLLRPVARHSALTATLMTRLVPLAAGDLARLREAQALRGPAAAAVGRAALARRLVAGSLDRALDAAATLELRGYGRGVPRQATRARRSRHSWRFTAAGAAIAVIGVGARIAGAGSFDAYPAVAIDLDAATLCVAASLPVIAALPFAGLSRRSRRRG